MGPAAEEEGGYTNKRPNAYRQEGGVLEHRGSLFLAFFRLEPGFARPGGVRMSAGAVAPAGRYLTRLGAGFWLWGAGLVPRAGPGPKCVGHKLHAKRSREPRASHSRPKALLERGAGDARGSQPLNTARGAHQSQSAGRR